MKALAQGVHVFSAVSPSHKLRIVQALQRAGLVVAMTGDGINDGPALKVADIGVAMGDRGAEVAQMTADVVLEEDDLETMIVAIRQGRAIYENTRSAIHYLLTTNMSEILVMSTGVAAGLGQPLTPMQLLWINLISDIFPVISLATQPPQGDVLERPPRDPNEPFIDRQDLVRMGVQSSTITAGAMGAYLWAIARYGLGPRAGTIGFLSLTVGQVLHMLSARSREHTIISPNRPALSQSFWCTFGAGLGLQAVALLVPGLRGLLGLVPLSPLDTGVSLLGATAPLVVNESLKALPGDAPRPVLPASGETSTVSPPTCSSQLV
jgi:Ca2+-transporting ATPase